MNESVRERERERESKRETERERGVGKLRRLSRFIKPCEMHGKQHTV
jgi:hypothetical protein